MMERWKKIVAGLVAVAASVLYLTHVHAAAPAPKSQAPGYYRMMLGDFQITALSDGTLALSPRQLLTSIYGHIRREGAGYVFYLVNYDIPK